MIGNLFGALEAEPLTDMAKREIGTDDRGRIDDPLMRAKLIQQEIDSRAFDALLERVADQTGAGESIGAMSSVLKYYGTELNKRRYELAMEVGGSDAIAFDHSGETGSRAADWLRTKGNSIEGGTSEVQLQIIAKHILQLPGA